MLDLAARISDGAVDALDLAPRDIRFARLSQQVLRGGATRFASVIADDQPIRYVIPVALPGTPTQFGALVLQDRHLGLVSETAEGLTQSQQIDLTDHTTVMETVGLVDGQPWPKFVVEQGLDADLIFLLPASPDPLLLETLRRILGPWTREVLSATMNGDRYHRWTPPAEETLEFAPVEDAAPESSPTPVEVSAPTEQFAPVEEVSAAEAAAPVEAVDVPDEDEDATRIQPAVRDDWPRPPIAVEVVAPQELAETPAPAWSTNEDATAVQPAASASHTWVHKPSQQRPPVAPVPAVPQEGRASNWVVGYIIGLLGALIVGGIWLLVMLLA